MKSLFNDTMNYTPEANDFSDKVFEVLKPLYKEAKEKGYNYRDVATIIDDCVGLETSIHVLQHNREQRQRKEDLKKASADTGFTAEDLIIT